MAALMGCGSSSSSGGSVGSFSTSTPPSTQLGQLSSAQLAGLCSDLNKFATGVANNASFKQGECKLLGLTAAAFGAASGSPTDAQLQKACSDVYNPCVAAPSQPKTVTCSAAPPASCTATVAQYTACLNDSLAATSAAFASVPACSSLTVASLSADGGTSGGNDQPASCQTFSAACSDTGDLPDPTFDGP